MENTKLSMYLVFALVFLMSTFFAYLAQPKGGNGRDMGKTNLFFYLLSFLIPWAVISFTNIGVDYANYELIIDRFDWDNLNDQGDSEYGFNVLAMLLNSIMGGNVHGVIFLLKTLTIIVFFVSFYLMRDQVYLVHSIMFYLLMIYVPSFYILAQFFAVSLITLLMVYYIKGGKKIVTLALLIPIGMIHNSVFLFIPFFLLSAFGKGSRVRFGWLIIICVISIIFSEVFYRYVQSFEGFHYNYLREEKSGTGWLVCVRSAVMIWLVFMMYKQGYEIKKSKCLVYFSVSICLFEILGLKFDVITRMTFNFSVVYTILIPAYLRYHKESNKDVMFYYMIILFMLYCGYNVVTNRIGSNVAMMNYFIPFNPFK